MTTEHRDLDLMLSRLAASGMATALVDILEQEKSGLVVSMHNAVLKDVPAFAASGNPAILPSLNLHLLEQVEDMVRVLESGTIGNFAFAREQAQRRAEQRFPLEAMLQTNHTIEAVLIACLRKGFAVTSENAASLVSDFVSRYSFAVSATTASEYVAQTRLLAEADGDRRNELLNLLLSGYDESDAHVSRMLQRAGYLEQHQSYCVAVVQSTNPAEMDNTARTQRIVNAISETMAESAVRTLVGLRGTHVVAVLSARRRQSGWTAPQTHLATRVRPKLDELGPSVLIGVSSDQPSTSYLPKALQEAMISLDFANVANRVVEFGSLPIRDLLVHHGADYLQSTAPAWITSFIEADAKANGNLLTTLRAVADANLNVQEAARNLGKHPNTIYTRLEKIAALTGRNGQNFHDLSEMLLAVDCWPN